MKNTQTTKESTLSIVSKKSDGPSINLINPKREELTPALLKTFPGYKELSDKEAEEKCGAIKTFARLLLQYLSTGEKTTCIDSQQVISLNLDIKDKVISIKQSQSKQKAA